MDIGTRGHVGTTLTFRFLYLLAKCEGSWILCERPLAQSFGFHNIYFQMNLTNLIWHALKSSQDIWKNDWAFEEPTPAGSRYCAQIAVVAGKAFWHTAAGFGHVLRYPHLYLMCVKTEIHFNSAAGKWRTNM